MLEATLKGHDASNGRDAPHPHVDPERALDALEEHTLGRRADQIRDDDQDTDPETEHDADADADDPRSAPEHPG